MSRKSKLGKEYALLLAEYVARFHQVPPSIVTEAQASELMTEALRRNESIEPLPNRQRAKGRQIALERLQAKGAGSRESPD